MKRIFLLAVIIAVAMVQINAQDSLKRNYVLGLSMQVNTLKIDGNINVTLVVAPNEPSIFVDGSENFTKKVKTSFVNGVMTVSAYSSSKSDDDVVIIYASSLSSLELRGDVKRIDLSKLNSLNSSR